MARNTATAATGLLLDRFGVGVSRCRLVRSGGLGLCRCGFLGLLGRRIVTFGLLLVRLRLVLLLFAPATRGIDLLFLLLRFAREHDATAIDHLVLAVENDVR